LQVDPHLRGDDEPVQGCRRDLLACTGHSRNSF
jgi:hypothetical protein